MGRESTYQLLQGPQQVLMENDSGQARPHSAGFGESLAVPPGKAVGPCGTLPPNLPAD